MRSKLLSHAILAAAVMGGGIVLFYYVLVRMADRPIASHTISASSYKSHAVSHVLAEEASCVVYGIDDVMGWNSRFYETDIYGPTTNYLTGILFLYNLEGLEHDAGDNLFYAVAGGGVRPGLYVMPPDFSDVHKIVSTEFDKLYALALHPQTGTLYAWSGSKAGNKGLVKITKSGDTLYNGFSVFDTMELVLHYPQQTFSGLAWFDEYLYGLDADGNLYRGDTPGEPNKFMKLPNIDGVPINAQKFEALDITKEGIMLIGVHDAGNTDLMAVDGTKMPPAVIESYDLGRGQIEDTEGIVWPDTCPAPVVGATVPSPSPGATRPPQPTATRAPTISPGPANANIYCPI